MTTPTNLPTTSDATYTDSGTDPSVKLHQQWHDILATAVNALTGYGTPTNPITDVNGGVNTALAVNWFQVPAEPVNARPNVDNVILVPPAQVGSLTSSAITATATTIGHAAVTYATSYQHERKTTGGTAWAVVGSSSTTSFAHTGLVASTSYDYRVSAIGASGSPGTPSAVLTVSTAASSTPTPTTVYSNTFETGLGGFAAATGNPTVTQDGTRFASGSKSAKVVATAAGNNMMGGHPSINVTAGQVVTVNQKVSTAQAKAFTPLIDTYTTTAFAYDNTYYPNTLGTGPGKTVGTIAAGTGFTSMPTWTFTVPAGIVMIVLKFDIDSGQGSVAAVGDSYWVDDVTVTTQ